MKPNTNITRREVIKTAALGSLVVPITAISKHSLSLQHENQNAKPSTGYPSIDNEVVKQVVLFSHFDLDKLKALVDERPELARAAYDWAFGDWETAIGAASHVGRLDIVNYLISKGARSTIFTHVALGQVEVVKAMIEANPGIQGTIGPHGISLLQHAKISARSKDRTAQQKKDLDRMVKYLEKVGGAELENSYLETDPESLKIYEGDYLYRNGEQDGFSIQLNSRKMIALGRLGTFGGGLFKIAEHRFVYNGTPSTEVSFEIVDGRSVSMQVIEPNQTIKAVRK